MHLVIEGPVDSNGAIIPKVTVVGNRVATGDALIDTGCSTTAITESLINQLAILPHTKDNVQHADGSILADAYYVKIGLPGHQRPPFMIRAIALRDMGIDMLLGMNVIRLGRLVITENRYSFTLREPST